MFNNKNIYIPPTLKEGRFVFFAVDNVDFSEDTPDGKRTLHGTVMTVYQQLKPGDTKVPLVRSSNTTEDHDKQNDIIPTISCKLSSSIKPAMPEFPYFKCLSDATFSDQFIDNLCWLFSKTSTVENSYSERSENIQFIGKDIPTWSAYNSVMFDTRDLTNVDGFPLVSAHAHEFSTLLSVFRYAELINQHIMVEERKIVVSVDLGLYKPAKQLEFARDDCQNNWIIRPGELHIVMALLRTIGAYIDHSCLDEIWLESGIYSSTTIKQIIEGKNVKRAMKAHITFLQSLFFLYKEQFFEKHQGIKEVIDDLSNQINLSIANENFDQAKDAHYQLSEWVKSKDILTKLKEFDEVKYKLHPVFQFVRQYMHMVHLLIMFVRSVRQYMHMVHLLIMFVRSVRTGNWNLHLQSLEAFLKFFFAHDKLNYARLIPLYLAEMHSLKDTDPHIYAEFEKGNWAVNKNSVTFCSIVVIMHFSTSIAL